LRQIVAAVISILMPVKNAGNYLKPCLDSILAQTYSDWELIAVNDRSTDGSNKLLQEYANKNINIIYAENKGSGIIAALQTAYGICSGETIHRMDADDIMPPSKLDWMYKALKKGSVVTGKVSYFCDERTVGEGFMKYTAWLNELMEVGDFWRDVYRECPIPSSAWLMYRFDFERIGRFESSQVPEDYDLAFRVMKNNLNVIRLKEVVLHWRDSETRTSRNEEQYFPIAYLPLKIYYFLKLHKDSSRPLVLWGAGKKGKLVAKLLLDREVHFEWMTDNPNKVGREIYGIILRHSSHLGSDSQLILALSSPDDQELIQKKLSQELMVNNRDYFWFF
jgi:glycosyltransferase involved in cell wall biosynthesis